MKLLLALLFMATLSSAQKNMDPTPQDVQLAKNLKAQYPKDEVVLLNSQDNVVFSVDKAGMKVSVINSIDETLMNISQRADINKYEFYDSESSIETFALKYRSGNPAYIAVKDEFYKDKDFFYNDARVKYSHVDFPVQGYSYKFELKKKYNDVKYFTSLYFNDEFPVVKKTITVTIPEWLDAELREFNFAGHTISKTQALDPKSRATVYTFTMENVPAYAKEENAPGRSYLYPHILLIAKSFKHKDKTVTLFNSSTDVYKWYKSLVDLMKDDTEIIKEKTLELTANAKSDEEKIRNIYYWVQDNIRYIAFEDGIAGFKPDEANNVLTKRYGDCKGMANLTRQMLKAAGFDARLTWIGTNHISYDYSTPSLAVDNHMICTLFHNGKKYFLDGTEKYNSFGEYAYRIQDKEVMIENGDDFIRDKVPSASADINKEVYEATLRVENEQLVGNCFKSCQGESRSRFLYTFNNFQNDKKENALQQYLSRFDKNIEVGQIKTSDLKNRDQKLTVEYEIAVNNKVSGFDNDMYIDFEFMNEYRGLDLSERKTDYEFDFKNNYESRVTFAIPDGYKVRKLPENLTVKHADFDIDITFDHTGKNIVYHKKFIFKTGVIRKAELEKWNNFNKSLVNLYNQQIVLTKQ